MVGLSESRQLRDWDKTSGNREMRFCGALVGKHAEKWHILWGMKNPERQLRQMIDCVEKIEEIKPFRKLKKIRKEKIKNCPTVCWRECHPVGQVKQMQTQVASLGLGQLAIVPR